MGKSLSTHLNPIKRTREMENADVFPLEKVPDLVLLCIANHLPDEDARHLSLTCQRFRNILPNYPHIINGPKVDEGGPHDGHFVPTNYFTGPVLEYNVDRIEMSMARWDQVRMNLFLDEFFYCYLVFLHVTIFSTYRDLAIEKDKFG